MADSTGPTIEDISDLYQRAVANNWQTVHTTTQQSLSRLADSHGAAAEAAALMKLAQALVASEPTRPN